MKEMEGTQRNGKTLHAHALEVQTWLNVYTHPRNHTFKVIPITILPASFTQVEQS